MMEGLKFKVSAQEIREFLAMKIQRQRELKSVHLAEISRLEKLALASDYANIQHRRDHVAEHDASIQAATWVGEHLQDGEYRIDPREAQFLGFLPS